jgi:hypothetical protein
VGLTLKVLWLLAVPGLRTGLAVIEDVGCLVGITDLREDSLEGKNDLLIKEGISLRSVIFLK